MKFLMEQILNEPVLIYEPDYYGNQGTVYIDNSGNQIFNAVQSNNNNANYYVITNNRNNSASLNLVSDTGVIGSGSNIRELEYF